MPYNRYKKMSRFFMILEVCIFLVIITLLIFLISLFF